MSGSVKIKKQNNKLDPEELEKLSKQELIQRIQSLQAHNNQLRNIIAKKPENVEKPVFKNQKSYDFTKCRFRRILLKLFYLGWDYHGYVVQEDTTNTIEHCLFEALTKTCLIKDRTTSNYHRCGRTDKGVSSFGQVISIDVRSKFPPDKDLDSDLGTELNYCKMLNAVLPDNIQCTAWCPIPANFSARFDCRQRTYKYFFPKGNLDIERMRKASELLLGSHDFRNLCKMDVGNGVVEFIRNIKAIDIQKCDRNELNDFSMFVLTISGQAFLWHQIRCIMGVLLLIGEGKEDETVIEELFDIQGNPRKPEYAMSSEIPLNLFHCDYDLPTSWQFEETAMNMVKDKLNHMWTLSSVKTAMIKTMMEDLDRSFESNVAVKLQTSSYLLQGAKMKSYVPLMKRQKCESLEDKIQHFVKRSRIEITEKDGDIESS